MKNELKKKKRKEDWEALLVGNTSNWLTVISIEQAYYNGKKCGYLAICQCKCGNIYKYPADAFYRTPPYSCGCYRRSNELIEKQHRWQKDESRMRASAEKNRQFYINHPEKREELSLKNKQFRIDNPDIVKTWADNRREYYNNHPEARQKASNSRKRYFIENPDKRKELSESLKKYYRDHPDKKLEIVRRSLEWRANNPEQAIEMHRKQRLWVNDKDKLAKAIEKRINTLKDNPDIQKNSIKKFKIWAKNNRKKLIEASIKRINSFRLRRKDSDFSELLNIIHPDFIESLLDGSLCTTDIIKTKCPKCCKYDDHYLHNVFVFRRNCIKYGSPPLCSSCRNYLSSSRAEQEIADYISTFYSGELIRNDRSILCGKELDLYYPEKKIAVEFNGSYWHNEHHRPRDYHYNKFKSCLDRDILLISIFESDWNSRKEDIKQYILDTFSEKINSLSLITSHIMNNNYPVRNYLHRLGDYIEDSYVNNNINVYTCGHSTILDTIGY